MAFCQDITMFSLQTARTQQRKLKDGLLWFEADTVKWLYLRQYCWDFNILCTK